MTVIPFPLALVPPPLQRAVLQPSVHARGARPYAFVGGIDDWHAPGALVKSNTTRCAVDAAWLVERVLGKAKQEPAIWPGVPGAREMAIELGRRAGLYNFQQEGAAFLAERDYALLFDEMGCLSSDTRVTVSFGTDRNFVSISIGELYRRWEDFGRKDGVRTLVNHGAGRELALVGHPIKNVLYKGRRPVLRIETERRSICVTPDHEMFIFSGAEVRAERLRIGDRMKTVDGTETITNIGPAGEASVFDIVCADPYRNFVANGFVVHNCGKTGQALVAAEARLALGHIPNPEQPVVLVLSPALGKWHWQREIKKWTGHESSVLETLTPTELPQTRYVIANYDILYGARRKDAAGVVHDAEHLPGWGGALTGRFLIVIADEVHALRGRDSRRTKAVKSMTRGVPVMWGLSGTPMPNYVRDLWSTFDVVTGGLQGFKYWDWAKTYCDASQQQYGWKDTGQSNIEALRGRMTFFCLGRTTSVVGMELPEKRREIYKIDVTVSAPTVAEGVRATQKIGFVAKALRATAVAKRSAVVAQIVEALEAKQKVGVGVYMREQADAIAKAVREKMDCSVFCVHGDLTPEGRDAQASTFRDCAAPAVFIATIDSVTMAISLVGADLVLFGDLVPEPWKLLQFEKRFHRHGSTKRVLVRYLIGAGTIDEGVAETVIEKLSTIEEALGQDEGQSDLRGLLGGGQQSEESIIDGLFSRLKTLGGSHE